QQGMAGMTRIVVFAVVGYVGSYVLASRQLALRYLLPSGLCGVLLYVLAIRLHAWDRSSRVPGAALVVVGTLLARHVPVDIASHNRRIADGLRVHADIAQAVSENRRGAEGDPIVIFSFRVPEPSYALRMDATAPDLFAVIESRYPKAGHYDPWLK